MPEAALTLTQSSDTLLDYSLTTAPVPLQVSASATAPSHGTITIVVSNSRPDDDVVLTSIEIDLVVGRASSPEADDLTEVGAGIAISVSDPAWQGTYPGTTDGRLLVTPTRGVPVSIGDQGLAITITDIQVSTEPGTTKVTIAEKAAIDGNPPSLTTAVLTVAKFPVGFAAGGFSVTQAVVANGTPVTMTWYGTQGTDITYTILWSGGSVEVSSVDTWTSPPLTDTTTFLLQVVQDAPGGGRLLFPATVIVSDPDIEATSLHVRGRSVLEGPVTVATSAAFADGSELTGTINAMGATFAVLSTAVPLDPGTYTANTDGFLVGHVNCPDQSRRTALCQGTITAIVHGMTTRAVGGNVVVHQSNGFYAMGPSYGSFVVPVCKNYTFVFGIHQDPDNQVDAPYDFAFWPLGSAQGPTLLDHVSDAQPPPPDAFAVVAGMASTAAGAVAEAANPRRRRDPM